MLLILLVMKKAEIIIGILSLIGLALNILLVPGGNIVIILTMGMLSLLYGYFSFALFNGIKFRAIFKKESYKGISTWRIVGAVGAGLALSMSVIGMLFKFQSWPGAVVELEFGLFWLFIVTIIGTIKYLTTQSEYYTGILKRVALYGGIALLLALMPKTAWVEIKYRNHPAYLQALKESINNPGNKELWEKVQIERNKMNGEITPNDTCFYSIHVPQDIDVPSTPHFDTTIVRTGDCPVRALRLPSWGTETSYSLAPEDSSSAKQYEPRSTHFSADQRFGIIDITDLPVGNYTMHLTACGNGGFFTVRLK